MSLKHFDFIFNYRTGSGSENPEPGGSPLGDADGLITPNWFPYAGVRSGVLLIMVDDTPYLLHPTDFADDRYEYQGLYNNYWARYNDGRWELLKGSDRVQYAETDKKFPWEVESWEQDTSSTDNFANSFVELYLNSANPNVREQHTINEVNLLNFQNDSDYICEHKITVDNDVIITFSGSDDTQQNVHIVDITNVHSDSVAISITGESVLWRDLANPTTLPENTSIRLVFWRNVEQYGEVVKFYVPDVEEEVNNNFRYVDWPTGDSTPGQRGYMSYKTINGTPFIAVYSGDGDVVHEWTFIAGSNINPET